MQDFSSAFSEAFRLIASLDAALLEIVGLSLFVSLIAIALSCLIAFPLAALLVVTRFTGRQAIILVLNAAMGLPPVVIGLTLYLLLSRAGPLGALGLLYTPAAMILAQMILVTPIVAAIALQALSELSVEYDETLRAMRASRKQIMGTLVWDGRGALMTAALAGLGRALAEVGAVMIVGGNIDHATRVMTTAIALETSRGELALALALGLVLLAMTLALNAIVMAARPRNREFARA